MGGGRPTDTRTHARTLWCVSLPAHPHPPHTHTRPARAQGDIVEGSESEIRAGMFVVALTRETVPATGELAWRVVELAMHGNQLYL